MDYVFLTDCLWEIGDGILRGQIELHFRVWHWHRNLEEKSRDVFFEGRVHISILGVVSQEYINLVQFS